jgi:sec-independent protein translocase protein TatA
VAIVLLLFGATRLPALARSIGQSTKIFREEMKTDSGAPAKAGDSALSAGVDSSSPPAPGKSAKS